MFKLELSKVSGILVKQSNIFECDLKTAWEKWMHPAITIVISSQISVLHFLT